MALDHGKLDVARLLIDRMRGAGAPRQSIGCREDAQKAQNNTRKQHLGEFA